MNFLAHAYLSFDQPGVLAGNMMADSVRGNQADLYPIEIRKGILLHRTIDAYTDSHDLVKETRKVFYPLISHYSLVISDVIYDHFLGVHWKKFHPQSLKEFSLQSFQSLDQYRSYFPPKFNSIYPYMKGDNWFVMYSTREGIHRTIERLAYRSEAFVWGKETIKLFEKEYAVLENYFLDFFPQLVKHSHSFLKDE